ncbi:hypothetical protein EIP91_009822 [Steccherinum ochraceum]|uniref:SH3 domain-containing protein n=1 Tax=Steccherinum ochraceum TaxID=92696 RepID=A0A4R0RDR9_9APHY|nr:hypothetical protein EIP91_009822 [Steccherinum ochraceum]
MAPAAFTSLLARSGTPGQVDNSISGTAIGGIVIAAVAGVGMLVWAVVYYVRKKNRASRAENRNSAFLNVKGLVKDGEEEEKVTVIVQDVDSNAVHSLNVKGQFSRAQLDKPGVILPSKLRPDASREEILQAYTEEGTLPRPFAPFMLGGGGSPTPSDKDSDPQARPNAEYLAAARKSILSVGSMATSSHRFSVASVATTNSSIASRGPMGKRKIRQIFSPVLPDELVVSLNQEVTVINSFDDGWCIVGKDGLGGEVELGAVPAWCFVKPQPGLHAQRPMRVSSLGVTINIEAPGGVRDSVMSWSNF